MTDVSVRPAGLADAPAMARLIGSLGYPSTADEMRRRLQAILARDDFLTLVAATGTGVVGTIGVQLCPSYNRDALTGRIASLVVDEALRGQGIGGRLVAEAERRLRDSGVHGVFVNSRHHRVEAQRFYERLGYASNGIRMVKPFHGDDFRPVER